MVGGGGIPCLSPGPSGIRPAKWKEASVILIPKSGRDPALTTSFRPISVLPALSKVWGSSEDDGMQKGCVHVAPYSATEIIQKTRKSDKNVDQSVVPVRVYKVRKKIGNERTGWDRKARRKIQPCRLSSKEVRLGRVPTGPPHGYASRQK